jgi:hypothetical protein
MYRAHWRSDLPLSDDARFGRRPQPVATAPRNRAYPAIPIRRLTPRSGVGAIEPRFAELPLETCGAQTRLLGEGDLNR